MARLNWTRIALHVIFWLVYLPINAVVSCILQGAHIEKEFGMALVGETFSLPLKLAFTYFVFYYVIPLYLERSKIWQLIGLLLASSVITLVGQLDPNVVPGPTFVPALLPILLPLAVMAVPLLDMLLAVVRRNAVRRVAGGHSH